MVSPSSLQKITLFDNLGKVLLTSVISNNTSKLQLPFVYSKGVYRVVIQLENSSVYISKVILF
ncbi:T9SS type A sorting domain-containing protein [Flavobacterium ponti]|uniref:T9SS type A sorting domain-containing protein n=1 Tax=Flavobacterium ponti TaxID=665133 RepID=A0ABV9P6H3_9FLAO